MSLLDWRRRRERGREGGMEGGREGGKERERPQDTNEPLLIGVEAPHLEIYFYY